MTHNYIKNENITFYNVLKENKSIENQKKVKIRVFDRAWDFLISICFLD